MSGGGLVFGEIVIEMSRKILTDRHVALPAAVKRRESVSLATGQVTSLQA